ncbi:MAG: Uncharacterized protein G01um101416_144 [Microgenomates group bacterium Gr01-1014_16]|nr:MAG: Uncharacterized protein G01um101416_144 [Microgenomates group bacterium Gr01-1014_16]
MDPVPPEPAPTPPPVVLVPPSRPKVRMPFLIVLGVATVVSGAVIAYTQLGALQSAKPAPTPVPLAVVRPSPSPTPVETFFLTLTSPKSDELAVNEEVLVKGQTAPNINVVILSETDEVAVESDDSGNFEGTILLAEGTNSIVVTAYSDTGEEKSVSLELVYSP